MEWRDIESAPKDGTRVDLWTSDGERVCDAYWDNGETPPSWHAPHMFYDDVGEVEYEGRKATHWLPIPAPPEKNMMKWMPIESAPKDGTMVLGWPATGRYNQDFPAAMVWDGDRNDWIITVGGPDQFYNIGNPDAPTHWMELPAPPEVE